MKTVIVSLIFLAFLPCIQAKSRCSFQNASVRIDTIANYVVYRTAVDIQLPDSMNLANDESAAVLVRIDEIRDEKIAKWSVFVFRICKNDSIVFSYIYTEGDIPLCIHKYIPLIEKYVETVKLKQLPLREGEEPCELILLVRFLNSK